MIQIAYTSIATHPMKQSMLLALLQQSRLHNAIHGLNGILLYKDNSFFQVIEGRADKIDKLMLSISGDMRHHTLNILYRRNIEKHDFDGWSMGFVNIEEEQYDLDDWEMNTFRFPLQNMMGSLDQLINVSTARALVQQFSRAIY